MDPRQLGLSDDDLAALGYRTRGARARPEDASEEGARPSGERTGGVGRQASPAPAHREGPGARRWLLTVAFLVVAPWATSVQRLVPAPTPANRPDTSFSSARAVAQLVELARAPRPVGSSEHARVRSHLAGRLRRLELQVETTGAAHPVRSTDGVVDVAAPANIVARLPGTASTGSVLVVGHYDSGPLSPGAADGGAALAVILEAVRAVSVGPALRNDLLVVLADGGALGGLGLERFVRFHPAASDVSFVLAPAIVGATGPSWSVPLASATAGAPFADALSRPATAPSLLASRTADPVLAPLQPLVERGTGGWLLVGTGERGWSGGPLDTPDRVDERTVAHQGSQLLELIRAAGAHDFDGPSVPTGGEAFTTLRGAGIVSWPATRLPWTTLALLAAWAGIVFILHLRGSKPRRLLPGVVLGLSVVAAAWALGGPMTEAVVRAHPEAGRVAGVIYREGPLTLALLAVVAGMTVALYGIARLRFERGALYVGALAVPLLFAAWATFAAPGIAAWLQPVLAVAVACAAVVAFAFPEKPGGTWAWLATLVFCGAVAFLAMPGLEGTAAALTPASGAALAAGLAGMMLLVLPVGDWLLAPRAWWSPALAAGTAAGLVAMIMPDVQGPERHPEPTSLVLLLDDSVEISPQAIASAGRAISGSSLAALPAASPEPGIDDGSLPERAPAAALRPRRIAGTWLTVEGPGEAWSRSWAVPGAVGPRGPGGLLLPRESAWVVAGAGAAADLAPPTIELLEATDVPGGWTATLAVRSGLRGEVVALRLPDGSPGRIRSVDGVPLADAGADGPVRAVRRWGSADDEPPRFELHFPDDVRTVSLDVIEHHLRPAELLGSEFFVRNTTVIADASTGSDRVIQRSAVRLRRPPPS